MANSTPLTQTRLREYLHYEPATGVFTWIKGSGPARAGRAAGCISHTTGYRYICILGRREGAHRLAFLYMTGAMPPEHVDHINGVRDDNRWVNLRLATVGQNRQNQRIGSANTSGLLGASWDKSRQSWIAMITVDRKQKNLGRYPTKEEAHAAYVKAKRELHPYGTL